MAKKVITNKQKSILTLILNFRFINSKQIQTFLQHKDHRRINSWLKDLVEKGYIERDFKPVFGTLTKPAVYFLAKKGRDYLRSTYDLFQTKYLARLHEDKKRTKAFRIRCQLVAELYLYWFRDKSTDYLYTIDHWLRSEVKFRNKTFEFVTPLFFEDLEFGLVNVLKPDANIHYQKSSKTIQAMVYVLDAYIPRLMIRYLLQRIFKALDEETWENEDIDSLQFYLVCPNNITIIYLRRLLTSFLENYYGSNLLVFNLTTRNKLFKDKHTKTGSGKWTHISSTDT